ncbi:DUF2310 family Zn-ribbon-containing protein [Leeia sp. IMCC25680]|uniref:DUF2310 family Zn-ribbon-containing protein n=1 Tax=Leeia aquatica TaxID=2725557 RepID=A0A847SE93_9NEIS|nr:DUF2310 family Zn-ribbon-containing protein [Leeia aquatica]
MYHQVMAVLAALYRHGQICGQDWPVHWEGLHLMAQVQTLEVDALDAVYHSAEVRRALAALPPQGMAVQYLGEGASEAMACSCVHSSSFALYTHFLHLGSPVRCLDCGGQVPLYRLLPGALHSQVLLSWQSDYRACDSLQMGCELLEAETTYQLAALDSALTRRGRALCDALTQQTGRPFYYYLYCHEGSDLESESRRPCPSCGQAWPRQRPRIAPFDFQCDPCRLLSNIAFEVGWMGQ